MATAIVKQLDASDIKGVSDALVGYVEITAGDESYWSNPRYSAVVHRRPVQPQEPALAHCGHEHREQGTAEQCLRRLLRKATREMQAPALTEDQALAGWVRSVVQPERKR